MKRLRRRGREKPGGGVSGSSGRRRGRRGREGPLGVRERTAAQGESTRGACDRGGTGAGSGNGSRARGDGAMRGALKGGARGRLREPWPRGRGGARGGLSGRLLGTKARSACDRGGTGAGGGIRSRGNGAVRAAREVQGDKGEAQGRQRSRRLLGLEEPGEEACVACVACGSRGGGLAYAYASRGGIYAACGSHMQALGEGRSGQPNLPDEGCGVSDRLAQLGEGPLGSGRPLLGVKQAPRSSRRWRWRHGKLEWPWSLS